MNRKSISALLGGVIISLMPVTVVTAETGGVAAGYPELASILQRVTENYPSITRYDAAIGVLDQKKEQVTSWDDPMLKLGLNNVPTDSPSLNKDPMTQKNIGISQKIYASGKLDKRGEVMEKRKAEVQSRRDAEVETIIKELKINYFNLSSLLIEKEMVLESERLLQNFVSIARKKYEVGRGNQTNILEAEVELSKLREWLIQIDKQAAIYLLRINRYLGKETKYSPKPQMRLFYSKLEAADKNLVDAALKRNPNLQMVRDGIETTRTQRELAGMNSSPDYNLSLGYGQRDSNQGASRSDLISLQVSMNLPFFQQGKRSAELRETEYEEISLTKQREDLLNRLESEVLSSAIRIRKDEELIQLYANGILPQKSQSLQTAFSNYQTDRIDFLFLLNIEIGLLKDKVRMIESIFNHEIAVAELEELIGSSVITKPHFVMEVKP